MKLNLPKTGFSALCQSGPFSHALMNSFFRVLQEAAIYAAGRVNSTQETSSFEEERGA